MGNQLFDDEFYAWAPPAPGKGQRGIKTGVQSVSVSRDGKWAASGGFVGTDPSSTTPTPLGFITTYDIVAQAIIPLPSPPQQASMVALSKDGTYLAVAADQLYLFKRTTTGSTTTWSSQSLPFSDVLRSVAISGNGEWIVAGISGGEVALVYNDGGTLASTVYPMPIKSYPDRFWVLGVAVSGNGNAFAVAGENATLYFFDIPATLPATLSEAWSETLPGCSACRAVSLADNGSRVAAIASQGGVGMPAGKGLVFVFDKTHTLGNPKWAAAQTVHGPNAISMDGAGNSVAVTDGTPKTHPPEGDFYVFNALAGTAKPAPPANHKMNYPIQIAAGGGVAVGGCDDGNVFYFAV
jgi:hypothetical protein